MEIRRFRVVLQIVLNIIMDGAVSHNVGSVEQARSPGLPHKVWSRRLRREKIRSLFCIVFTFFLDKKSNKKVKDKQMLRCLSGQRTGEVATFEIVYWFVVDGARVLFVFLLDPGGAVLRLEFL
jgi:hypothetical protein